MNLPALRPAVLPRSCWLTLRALRSSDVGQLRIGVGGVVSALILGIRVRRFTGCEALCADELLGALGLRAAVGVGPLAGGHLARLVTVWPSKLVELSINVDTQDMLKEDLPCPS